MSNTVSKPRIGQTGLPFEIEITEEDESAVQTPLDPTGATTIQIEFFGPNNTHFKKDAVSSQSMGKQLLTYTDPNTSSILTKAGKWKMGHYIVMADSKIKKASVFVQFEVAH